MKEPTNVTRTRISTPLGVELLMHCYAKTDAFLPGAPDYWPEAVRNTLLALLDLGLVSVDQARGVPYYSTTHAGDLLVVGILHSMGIVADQVAKARDITLE